MLGGVLLGILLFVGFEAAASIGEESHDPHRSIPRAVLWTVGVSAAFFVLGTYAFSVGYGETAVSQGAWALDPASVDTMATKYVGSWYATIVDLVVILDAMGLALAICVTIGRGYFALARDGLLPSAFTKVSRHNGGKLWQYLVVLVVVATPILGFYGALKPSPHSSSNYNYEALYWTIGVLVLAGVWFLAMQIMRPDRVRNAAAHASEHHGVPPLDENLDFTPAPPDTAI